LALVVIAGCGAGAALAPLSDFSSYTPPEAMAQRMEEAQRVSADELAKKHAVRFSALGYQPRSAANLDCIQKQPAAKLDALELKMLEQNGFVTSRDRPYASFALGHLALYKQDLPIFISADAILHAWHRAYDDLLVEVEKELFKDALDRYLERVRLGIDKTGAPRHTRAHLDTYLAVAHSLLRDKTVAVTSGGSQDQVEKLLALARAAQGSQKVPLFGRLREVDFSQFKPRGHYEKHPELIPYFRAMIWLGQTDFRAIETDENANTHFRRIDFDAFVAAREAMDEKALELWRGIDRLVSFFIGRHDSMTPEGLDRLARELGARGITDLYRRSDRDVEQAFRRSGLGKQQIMGHIYWKQPNAPQLPLNTSLALFGQRYSLDSHALTSVTEDRVPGRDLPNSRDVAFATLGNDFAYSLAAPKDLQKPAYVSGLASMRVLADGQKEEFWKSSLYSTWIWSLRALSPDLERPPAAKVTRTDNWARRMLATQLASWSELRHDTILYAKQSYSAFILCEYPDAYVDPYPEFFRRLAAQADLGLSVAARASSVAITPEQSSLIERTRHYFAGAKRILDKLREMAERNASGKRVTKEQLEFVNDMIDRHVESGGGGCGPAPVTYDGWYRDLLNGADVTDADITVADVHTGQKGILHVGKQLPRRMVVTVDWPDGVRAYAGVVFSFHEVTSSVRISDSEWARMTPPDPEWLAPVVAHAKR
jgi:hypothetical protein